MVLNKGVSTSDAFTDLTRAIVSNEIKYCAAISTDLKKAFDSISHNLLIIKLEKYGFSGVALKLLISFLNNINQFIILNNSKSQQNKLSLVSLKDMSSNSYYF